MMFPIFQSKVIPSVKFYQSIMGFKNFNATVIQAQFQEEA